MTHHPNDALPEVPTFSLVSSTFADGDRLPLPQVSGMIGTGGGDVAPALSWSGAPEGTQSYAVTCFDPDAPTGSGFWHWAVANIPASVTELPTHAGELGGARLPEGAQMMPNERRELAFAGAAPPEGTGVHHYWFVVHALDVERVDVDPQATPAVLGFMMREHVLARAVIVATGEYGQAA